jgi:hypothetical protein
VFLLLGVFHTAVLNEPMLVFGPAKYGERVQGYLGALLRGHFAVMLPLSLLVTMAALAFWWCHSGDFVAAAASLASSAILMIPLKPSLRPDRFVLRSLARDHWRYKRWAAMPGWVSDRIYFLVLPAGIGLAGAGALKGDAETCHAGATHHLRSGVLLLPVLASERISGGMHATNRTIRLFLLLFFSAAPFIWNFSGAFDGQIFREPYPGEYCGYASWPLRFVDLLPTAHSVQVEIGGSLRAVERLNSMFCSSVSGGVSAVALGVPLALHFGIGGALLAMLISYALMGALTVVFLPRFSRWEEV